MLYRKPLITLLIFSFLPIEIFAENNADSIPIYDLQEIHVNADMMVRKADMAIYHPSKTIMEQSSNGLQVLAFLSIPSLMVDDVMDKISAYGEDVQIRINGRIAGVEQVRALQPESIKRVEWIDNPGLRYNGANYVLNIIVTNQSLGGSLMASVQPMFNAIFGHYNLDLKLNNGRSQWNIGSYFKPCLTTNVHRNYHETFTFPDGETSVRTENPVGGKVKNSQGWINIGYSYIKPDTTIFYARLSAWSDIDNLARFYGEMNISNETERIKLFNETSGKGITPSLSLYLEQHFPHNQTLVVDCNSSIFTGYSGSIYKESLPETDYYLTDINTHIKDFNQAYGFQANYIKDWGKNKLTTGFQYVANRNRSKYKYLDNAVFHQNQDKVCFFAEYYQRLGNFYLTGGLGAQYTSFLFKESDQGNSSWNLRPQASISYSLNGGHQFRVNFTSWQTSPSLSETNITPQQIDGFQWNVGNPYLKTFNSYKLDFRYSFKLWRITGNFNVAASTSPDAIAPYLYWDNNKLITSYENSIGKQGLSFSIAPQIQIIPQWLTLSGYLEYLNERTQGTGYKLYNHNWNGNIQAVVTHWNFSFIIQYEKARRSLVGEKLFWGEDFSVISLAYKWKDLQIGTLIFMPFGTYDQGSKMLSKWNTNEYHLRLDLRMVGIQLNYNFQWGRQKQSVNKLIDSAVTVEKSGVKSR